MATERRLPGQWGREGACQEPLQPVEGGPCTRELLQDHSAPSLCPAPLVSLCSKHCACATQACQEEKEEQIQLSLTHVLSGKEGEDGFRGSFDWV